MLKRIDNINEYFERSSAEDTFGNLVSKLQTFKDSKIKDLDAKSIGEILKVILVLQQNACPESCLDSCDRPMLGGGPSCLVCNTRPLIIRLRHNYYHLISSGFNLK